MAFLSIIDFCCSEEARDDSLGTKRRVSWLACLGFHALGYYWFGWWGVLLCLLSSTAGIAMCFFEVRKLLWNERGRIQPS
jgi:hypothetical protein